jgi:hypothetical protein
MATGKKTGGRRKGTPNKATADRQAAVAASGKTPLAVMLENMRWADEEAIRLTERLAGAEPSLETEQLSSQVMRLRQLSVVWAHLAAPYVHPRLAVTAHRHTNADGTPLVPTISLTIMRPPEPRPQLTSVGPKSDDTVQ